MKAYMVVLLTIIAIFAVGCASSEVIEEETDVMMDTGEDVMDKKDVAETETPTEADSVIQDTEFLTEEDESFGDLI